jgi:hypothetical protein
MLRVHRLTGFGMTGHPTERLTRGDFDWQLRGGETQLRTFASILGLAANGLPLMLAY